MSETFSMRIIQPCDGGTFQVERLVFVPDSDHAWWEWRPVGRYKGSSAVLGKSTTVAHSSCFLADLRHTPLPT